MKRGNTREVAAPTDWQRFVEKFVPNSSTGDGYSLVELLTVVAIIAIVATMAGAGIATVRRASALGSSGSALLDHLSLARQVAMTHNQPVRIWFYKDAINGGVEVDTVLLYREVPAPVTGNITYVPVDRELKLQSTVAMAGDLAWSSVLTNATLPDPKHGSNLPTFRYLPDGSTDLPVGPAPTLTLVNRSDKSASSLPANFFTLQIDQQTGKIQTFRPR